VNMSHLAGRHRIMEAALRDPRDDGFMSGKFSLGTSSETPSSWKSMLACIMKLCLSVERKRSSKGSRMDIFQVVRGRTIRARQSIGAR
jgi:hypothetical protein